MRVSKPPILERRPRSFSPSSAAAVKTFHRRPPPLPSPSSPPTRPSVWTSLRTPESPVARSSTVMRRPETGSGVPRTKPFSLRCVSPEREGPHPPPRRRHHHHEDSEGAFIAFRSGVEETPSRRHSASSRSVSRKPWLRADSLDFPGVVVDSRAGVLPSYFENRSVALPRPHTGPSDALQMSRERGRRQRWETSAPQGVKGVGGPPAGVKGILKPFSSGGASQGRGGGVSKKAVHFDEDFLSKSVQRFTASPHRDGGTRGRDFTAEMAVESHQTPFRDDFLCLSWDHLDVAKLLEEVDQDEEGRLRGMTTSAATSAAGGGLLSRMVPFTSQRRASLASGGAPRRGAEWGGDSDWFNEQFGLTPRPDDTGSDAMQKEEEEEEKEVVVATPLTRTTTPRQTITSSSTHRPLRLPSSSDDPTPNTYTTVMPLRDTGNHTPVLRRVPVALPPMTVDDLLEPLQQARHDLIDSVPRPPPTAHCSGGEGAHSSSACSSSVSTPGSASHRALSEVERGLLRALVRANQRSGRVPSVVSFTRDEQCECGSGASAATTTTMSSSSSLQSHTILMSTGSEPCSRAESTATKSSPSDSLSLPV